MAGQSIVAIATIKSDRVDNAGLTVDIHGPGIPGPCMFVECGDVSSQWESRYVKVNSRILCCVAFTRMANEWNSARGKVPPPFPTQGLRD